MSGWREVWSLLTPPFSAACWSGGARRRSWPSDWGLECGASLLLRSRGGLLLPTAGKRVGYQTPPLWGHLRPSKVWRPISPHHFPCRWRTPSDISALVVLCVRGWAPRYTLAHSLAAAYRGLEPGARSGHFGDGVPSASRPGARSLRHSWLPAELTGTSLQPPLASAPRLLSDPSSGTLLSSF
ncbi:engulfment and cell motility protein 2 [Sarotherodon galilaeus]